MSKFVKVKDLLFKDGLYINIDHIDMISIDRNKVCNIWMGDDEIRCTDEETINRLLKAIEVE